MEKRKNPKDSIESFSEEELKKEADSVRKMIDQSPELQNLTVPEEVHQRLAERIKKYEEEKAWEGLSEKDREALRIGREIQKRNEEKTASEAALGNDSREDFKDDSENKKVFYRPKKRKTVFVLVAVLVVVLGMGLTSVGRKDIVVDVFRKTFGSGEKTYVDTEEIESAGEMTEDEAYAEIEKVFGTKKDIVVDVFRKTFGSGEKTYVDTEEIESAGEMTEDEAYAEIEKVFGTKVVRIIDKPDNTKFVEMHLDEELQEAILYYLVNDNVLSYRIIMPYVKSSSGMEIHDELIQEYSIQLPETDVWISEYQIKGQSGLEYIAKFGYKSTEYFLQGSMKQEDFEKIVKNLIFF